MLVIIVSGTIPSLYANSSKHDLSRFRDLLLQSLNQIAFFAFPASVLLLILRLPVVRLIFGTQNFPWPVTKTTSYAVGLIAVSIAAQAMTQLLLRAFYALKDTKTPLVITIISVLLYVGFNYFFVFHTGFGVLGIAFVTTIVAGIELSLLIVSLSQRVPNLLTNAFWVPQLKIVSASFLMAVFLYLPYRILDELLFNTSQTVELIALTVTTSTIGMVVYVYFAALFNIHELSLLKQISEGIGSWRKNLGESEEVLVEPTTESGEL